MVGDAPRRHSDGGAACGLTHAMAIEGREFGLTVSVVQPGNTLPGLWTGREEQAKKEGVMDAENVARVALVMANLPADVNLYSGVILPVATDVRKPEQCKAMIEAAVKEFGKLDILINNAGGAHGHIGLARMDLAKWDRDVQLNLSAATYCSQAAYPYLRASKGCVVNISSQAGVGGTQGVAAYSAAKAGLQMLTKVMAAEWGPVGIRVNCVAPGMTATEAAELGWEKRGYDAAAAAKESFSLKRYGTMREVSQGIVFFASPRDLGDNAEPPRLLLGLGRIRSRQRRGTCGAAPGGRDLRFEETVLGSRSPVRRHGQPQRGTADRVRPAVRRTRRRRCGCRSRLLDGVRGGSSAAALVELLCDAAALDGPLDCVVGRRLVRGEAVTHDLEMPVRSGDSTRRGGDPVPQLLEVCELLFDGEIIESVSGGGVGHLSFLHLRW